MHSFKKTILYGFLIWLIPFIVSFLVFPFHDSNRALFESIMAVAVTAATVIFANKYLKQVKSYYYEEGIKLGVVWFLINIIIDLIMFLPESQMHMGFWEYMADIGLTYLIIPIITIGSGYLLSEKLK